jgi:aspartate aminotransferase-like enzyme
MTPYDPETATFLVAGPVRIHPRVLRVMATPSLNHRGEAFKQVVADIRELLPVLFDAKGHQLVLTGSGTAGIEAVYSNLLRPNDRTIVISNGNFGDRTGDIARRYCDRVTPITVPWGQNLPVEAITAELEKGDVRAVCVVHNETSVGLTNDLARIQAPIRKSGALFLVDGISAVGGIRVPIEEWGIDALVAGSQKGLAAPAGLAMVHLSARARAELKPRSYYLDLVTHLASLEKNETPFTPAIQLFLALREALRLLQEETLAARIDRGHRLAEASRAASAALGLELLPDRQFASDTVTALKNPAGFADDAVRKELQSKYHVLLQGGQGALKGKIFRIGHMGIADWSDLLVTFAGLEKILARGGATFPPGAALNTLVSAMP